MLLNEQQPAVFTPYPLKSQYWRHSVRFPGDAENAKKVNAMRPECRELQNRCKERDFIPTWISAAHPASNQASIPTFQSRKICKSFSGISTSSIPIPLPVSPNPSKTNANTRTHFLVLCYTVIERYWPTHVEIPIFSSIIWYLGYTYSDRFETFTIG